MTSSLTGLRIVVIGVNFAPESTGIAPYTTDLCQCLARAGAEVRAITGMPHYPEWKVAPNFKYRLRAKEIHGSVHVTRVRHYVPGSQSAAKRALFEASFATSSYLASRRLQADLVIAVTPNIGALPVAAALARRNSAPLGVIVQDSMSLAALQSGVAGAKSVAGLGKWIEVRWLQNADRVGVISRGLIDALTAAGVDEKKLVYLPNYTHITRDRRDATAARRSLGWPADGFYVVHTGNIGFKQDLPNVVAAAQLADEDSIDVRFVILGDGNQRAIVERMSAGVRRLQVLPPVEASDYPTVLASADVLLVNERATIKDMSLPSKLTSYFAAGRPVVAATRPDGSTAAEVNRSGGGIVVRPGDPQALIDAVQLLEADHELRGRLAAAGMHYAESYLSQADAEHRLLGFASALARPDVRRYAG
jgi:colanic acid biosynthesis glycosyl transferase WcaI